MQIEHISGNGSKDRIFQTLYLGLMIGVFFNTVLFPVRIMGFSININVSEAAILFFSAGIFLVYFRNLIRPQIDRRIVTSFALFFLVVVLSACFSENRFMACKTTARYLTVTTAVFLIVRLADSRRILFMQKSLFYLALVASVVSLLEMLLPDFAGLLAAWFRHNQLGVTGSSYRTGAFFQSVNILGVFSGFAIFLGYDLKQKNQLKPLLFWIISVLLALAVISSGSRNALLGILVSGAVLLFQRKKTGSQ